MKKIFLYIDTLRRGGAQRVMANIANYLCDSGYEVHLVRDIPPDAEHDEYNLQNSIEVHILDDKKRKSLAKQYIRIKKLRKLLKEEKPDLVLSFLGRPNMRMLIATFGLSVVKVVSVRNDPYHEYGKGVRRFLAKALFYLADGVVFQTKDASKYFSKKVQSKSTIIPNPVNKKFYDIVRQHEEGFKIVNVGRLQPQKNQQLLIDAFHKIEDDFPNAKLFIYGDGALKNSLQKQEKSNIKLMGNIDRIENELTSATIFVLASNFEGMPNALMEAMAVGVPCISTDCPCGGPRFLIQNEEQGILVPCGDIDAMANAMRKLLQNERLRNQISKAAKARAEAFREGNVMNDWIAYLEAIYKEKTQ